MGTSTEELSRLSTGIPGLDEILQGGLLPRRTYLLRGGPGTGKTTLGFHFLTAGASRGETALFISMGEPEAALRANAERLGFDLSGIHFLDLSPTPEFFVQVETYDLFAPAEVEREPTTQAIVEAVESLQPQRIFIDAMTQFRYLAADPFQYRKQVLSFLRFLVEKGGTVLFTSEAGPDAPDEDLQFLADGIIHLGYERGERTISVTKFRGSPFLPGEHSMRITEKGMVVFPRLMPAAFRREFVMESISSGIPELDALLHGGIERGTVTIISGPTGVGKTTLGLQFMKEAAGRGERSVVYLFEEEPAVLVERARAISVPIDAMLRQGTLAVVRVEPLTYTPDEFARMVREEVEERDARIVMIDSVSAYRLSLRGEDLTTHLHALCKYMANMGVTVILVLEVEAVTGEFRATEQGVSYLADNIIFLRYLEVKGELRKAIGVLKKRTSDFEKTLREFEITRYGVKVGPPLTGLRGILTGTPEWVEVP